MDRNLKTLAASFGEHLRNDTLVPEELAKIKHGHRQQLAAASLGHKSLASYQSSEDELGDYCLLDRQTLDNRLIQLGYSEEYKDLVAVNMHRAAGGDCGMDVSWNAEDLRQTVELIIQDEVYYDDGSIAAQVKEINPSVEVVERDDTHVQLTETNGTLNGKFFDVPVAITIDVKPLDMDNDQFREQKFFQTNQQIKVTGTVRFIRNGRACFSNPIVFLDEYPDYE